MLLFVLLHLYQTAFADYCLPGENCWPTTTEWNVLGGSLDGPLHTVGNPSDEFAECYTYGTNAFRIVDGPKGLCMHNLACSHEFCFPQNSWDLPSYVVEAHNTEDIQTAINFANEHNIKVSIKSTGHSYHGASTSKDSLMIHMRSYVKYGEVQENWEDTCGDGSSHPATLKMGGGQSWREAYEAVGEDYHIVGGGGLTVGSSGGWLQGGGLSSTSREFGLGIDNVLQFEVVLASGEVVLADRCANPDLFWALRGGGGGTFGVVTYVVYKLHEMDNLVVLEYALYLEAGLEHVSQEAANDEFLRFWIAHSPDLDSRWGGYWRQSGFSLLFAGSLEDARSTFIDALESWDHERDFKTRYGVSTYLSVSETRNYYTHRDGDHCIKTREPHCTDPTGWAYYGIENIAARLVPYDFVKNNPEAAFEMISTAAKMPGFGGTNYFLGGKINDIPNDATAIHPAMRNAVYNIISMGPEIADYIRSVIGNDVTGVCNNHHSPSEPDWRNALFGENLETLQTLKLRFDPESRFECWHCVGYSGDEFSTTEAPAIDECPDINISGGYRLEYKTSICPDGMMTNQEAGYFEWNGLSFNYVTCEEADEYCSSNECWAEEDDEANRTIFVDRGCCDPSMLAVVVQDEDCKFEIFSTGTKVSSGHLQMFGEDVMAVMGEEGNDVAVVMRNGVVRSEGMDAYPLEYECVCEENPKSLFNVAYFQCCDATGACVQDETAVECVQSGREYIPTMCYEVGYHYYTEKMEDPSMECPVMDYCSCDDEPSEMENIICPDSMTLMRNEYFHNELTDSQSRCGSLNDFCAGNMESCGWTEETLPETQTFFAATDCCQGDDSNVLCPKEMKYSPENTYFDLTTSQMTRCGDANDFCATDMEICGGAENLAAFFATTECCVSMCPQGVNRVAEYWEPEMRIVRNCGDVYDSGELDDLFNANCCVSNPVSYVYYGDENCMGTPLDSGDVELPEMDTCLHDDEEPVSSYLQCVSGNELRVFEFDTPDCSGEPVMQADIVSGECSTMAHSRDGTSYAVYSFAELNCGGSSEEPADCVDDPDGIVAADVSKDCANVNTGLPGWDCDYYDSDFNGYALYVYELCPLSCGRCDADGDVAFSSFESSDCSGDPLFSGFTDMPLFGVCLPDDEEDGVSSTYECVSKTEVRVTEWSSSDCTGEVAMSANVVSGACTAFDHVRDGISYSIYTFEAECSSDQEEGQCSPSAQDCGDGYFCNHDYDDVGHCDSCDAVDCESPYTTDRRPCCVDSGEEMCSVESQDCGDGYFCNDERDGRGKCQSCDSIDCSTETASDRWPCCVNYECKDDWCPDGEWRTDVVVIRECHILKSMLGLADDADCEWALPIEPDNHWENADESDDSCVFEYDSEDNGVCASLGGRLREQNCQEAYDDFMEYVRRGEYMCAMEVDEYGLTAKQYLHNVNCCPTVPGKPQCDIEYLTEEAGKVPECSAAIANDFNDLQEKCHCFDHLDHAEFDCRTEELNGHTLFQEYDRDCIQGAENILCPENMQYNQFAQYQDGASGAMLSCHETSVYCGDEDNFCGDVTTYFATTSCCSHVEDGLRYEMKWCDGDMPMYSLCSDGCGAPGEQRCANADSGACQHFPYGGLCGGYSWVLEIEGTSTQAICRNGVHVSQHFMTSDCTGDVVVESEESSSCYGVPIEEGRPGYNPEAEFTMCNAAEQPGRDNSICPDGMQYHAENYYFDEDEQNYVACYSGNDFCSQNEEICREFLPFFAQTDCCSEDTKGEGDVRYMSFLSSDCEGEPEYTGVTDLPLFGTCIRDEEEQDYSSFYECVSGNEIRVTEYASDDCSGQVLMDTNVVSGQCTAFVHARDGTSFSIYEFEELQCEVIQKCAELEAKYPECDENYVGNLDCEPSQEDTDYYNTHCEDEGREETMCPADYTLNRYGYYIIAEDATPAQCGETNDYCMVDPVRCEWTDLEGIRAYFATTDCCTHDDGEDMCSVELQNCGEGYFCNHEYYDSGKCQSCESIDCRTETAEDRWPCCVDDVGNVEYAVFYTSGCQGEPSGSGITRVPELGVCIDEEDQDRSNLYECVSGNEMRVWDFEGSGCDGRVLMDTLVVSGACTEFAHLYEDTYYATYIFGDLQCESSAEFNVDYAVFTSSEDCSGDPDDRASVEMPAFDVCHVDEEEGTSEFFTCLGSNEIRHKEYDSNDCSGRAVMNTRVVSGVCTTFRHRGEDPFYGIYNFEVECPVPSECEDDDAAIQAWFGPTNCANMASFGLCEQSMPDGSGLVSDACGCACGSGAGADDGEDESEETPECIPVMCGCPPSHTTMEEMDDSGCVTSCTCVPDIPEDIDWPGCPEEKQCLSGDIMPTGPNDAFAFNLQCCADDEVCSFDPSCLECGGSCQPASESYCNGDFGDAACICPEGSTKVAEGMPILAGRRKLAIMFEEAYCRGANSCMHVEETMMAGGVTSFYDCLCLDTMEIYEVTSYFPANGDEMPEDASIDSCDTYRFYCVTPEPVLVEVCTCSSYETGAMDGSEMCQFGDNCALASGFDDGCPINSSTSCVLSVEDETTDCGMYTNACDCVGECGWSSSSMTCVSASESSTNCVECSSMDNCVAGDCSSYGCGSFDSNFVCGCDDACETYGNCCSDYGMCVNDDEASSDGDCMDDEATLQQYYGTSTNCAQIASFGLCTSEFQVGSEAFVVTEVCAMSCGSCEDAGSSGAEEEEDSSESESEEPTTDTDAPEATQEPEPVDTEEAEEEEPSTGDDSYTCGTTMEECEAAYMAAMTPAVTAMMATETMDSCDAADGWWVVNTLNGLAGYDADTMSVCQSGGEYMIQYNGMVYPTCVAYGDPDNACGDSDLICPENPNNVGVFGYAGNQRAALASALTRNDFMHPMCPTSTCKSMDELADSGSYWKTQLMNNQYTNVDESTADNVCVTEDNEVMFITTEGKYNTCLGWSSNAAELCDSQKFLCAGHNGQGLYTYGWPGQLARTLAKAVTNTDGNYMHPQCPLMICSA